MQKSHSCKREYNSCDEFNRINVEVLSVVASQLQQLFSAKACNATEIVFEESLELPSPSQVNYAISENSEIQTTYSIDNNQVFKVVVKHIATGCMMFKREVFLYLADKCPERKYSKGVNEDELDTPSFMRKDKNSDENATQHQDDLFYL